MFIFSTLLLESCRIVHFLGQRGSLHDKDVVKVRVVGDTTLLGEVLIYSNENDSVALTTTIDSPELTSYLEDGSLDVLDEEIGF